MNFRTILMSGISLAIVAGAGTAHAADFYNGWYYAIDSQNDGSGGVGYEHRGLAFTTVGHYMVFALSSGMPLGGTASGSSVNGSQANGEMFLNFSSHNLDTQAKFTDANVFAVRFDANNDSLGNVGGSNPTLGLFGDISVFSAPPTNNGYGSLQQYINAGFGRNPDAMGDLEDSSGDVTYYLSNGTQYTNISEGRYMGGVLSLTRGDLNTVGLDFGHFGADPSGNNVYGFAIDGNLRLGEAGDELRITQTCRTGRRVDANDPQ